MATNNPCYQCQDRHVGCHSSCERYTSWKTEHEQQNAEKRKNADSITYELRSSLQQKYKRFNLSSTYHRRGK